MQEAWRFWWTNTPNPPQSGYHPANRIPPSIQPTERFRRTDRKTFSRLVQCRTGHAHTGEYYKRFVPTEDPGCPCGATLQSREHILGYGRHAQVGRLMGTVKAIRKRITFIKRSGAFDKTERPRTGTNEEAERARREEEWDTSLREKLNGGQPIKPTPDTTTRTLPIRGLENQTLPPAINHNVGSSPM